MNTFCVKEDILECKRALLGFQSKIENLSEIELQLSFLHSAKVELKNQKTAILYASNALDDEYTKRIDYRTMMENYKKSLQAEEKIVIIYKSGGTASFGVYELSLNPNRELVVTTTCRDNYTWSKAYKFSGKPYSIHLDRLSSTSKPQSCKNFLK
ncbi:MAG: hypothetical protein JJT78_12890 [Leptospira sp.]|nr:hypothetical protein [Leptospira sp.]